MFRIVEEELGHFFQQVKNKVNESCATLKNLEEVHQNLSRILAQLSDSKSIVTEGSRELPETLEKVIGMDGLLYLETFNREAAGYSQKLLEVDFEVSINQAHFKKSISESLRVKRAEEEPPSISASKSLKGLGVNLQTSRSRSRSPVLGNSNVEMGRQVMIDSDLEPKRKVLHFFETGSPHLHLIEVTGKGKLSQQVINLGNFNVPTFHSSVMSSQGFIFMSGGIMEVEDNDIKSPQMARFSLLKRQDFKKDFSKVRPRSSHSLCEVDGSIYILGGYGPGDGEDPEVESSVEKVNTRTGQVEVKSPSKFGGACIATLI